MTIFFNTTITTHFSVLKDEQVVLLFLNLYNIKKSKNVHIKKDILVACHLAYIQRQ